MKHLLTAIACFFALSMSAQTPYNPDSNGDNFIGSHDLLDFLPLYDSPFFATDSIVVQTVDSAVYLIDTCFYNPVPSIQFTMDSNCTAYTGDSVAQATYVPYAYGDEIFGMCYVYNWEGYNSSYQYQLPVEIEESADWVNWQVLSDFSLGMNLELPADSSFKKLYVALDASGYMFGFYSQGEFIGRADGGVGSDNYMSRLVILVRDNKGKWYWSRQPNREERARLFDHGYYGDAKPFAVGLLEGLPSVLTCDF